MGIAHRLPVRASPPHSPYDARLGQGARRGIRNRVLDRVAPHAPNLRDKIRAIDVLSPDNLRGRNPNAVSGDPYGGSADLDQSFLWRPLASSGRHGTPVSRLWHIGASTHPGPGLGSGSGHLVATTLNQTQDVATLNALGR